MLLNEELQMFINEKLVDNKTVSEQTGISLPTISRLKNEKRISPRNLLLILKVLDFPNYEEYSLEIKSAFPERTKQLREDMFDYGITFQRLGKALGYSKQYVSAVLSGASPVTAAQLEKIEKVIDELKTENEHANKL